MKTSIWDILTGVVLLGILVVIGTYGAIFLNIFNPFPPAAPVQPTVAPMKLPSATETSAALPPTWTPEGQATVVKPASVTLRPTSTPMPTSTPVVLPTFTPSKTPRTVVAGGKCIVIAQEPKDDSILQKDAAFTTHWTIKNNTSQVWRADSVDIRFVSGDRVHATNDVMDMPYDVGAGGMLDLNISMTAPSTAGSYVSNWAIGTGTSSICNFFVTFRVP